MCIGVYTYTIMCKAVCVCDTVCDTVCVRARARACLHVYVRTKQDADSCLTDTFCIRMASSCHMGSIMRYGCRINLTIRFVSKNRMLACFAHDLDKSIAA
jgi:hypothetical protein